jgi:hypothetical protein
MRYLVSLEIGWKAVILRCLDYYAVTTKGVKGDLLCWPNQKWRLLDPSLLVGTLESYTL